MATERREQGLAVLVGAGPGDIALITSAAIRWLSRAEAVIYDRLANPALLAMAPAAAERIYVGKTVGGPTITQEQINQILVDRCRAGKLVVRLKGGDPFIFGRGGEEADALVAAALPFRVVPGITAGIAAGACAGIPLTDRRAASNVAFVTGHEDPAKDASSINWQALAGIDTLVFYMGVENLPAIAERLIACGKPPSTPAAVVQRASLPDQRTVVATLATIAEQARAAGVRPPAITIVGEVVSLRRRLAWLERLPLFGRTILVTRSRQQASALSQALIDLGANAIEAPTIDIQPPEDFAPVDAALGRLGQFDWLVLTSPNGATALMDRLDFLGLDARALARLKIAAVGSATAEALRGRSIRADLVPRAFTTRKLGEALVSAEAVAAVQGKRVLLARADIATQELTSYLAAHGAIVTEIDLYRTVRPDILPEEAAAALKDGRVDWITFTSSSTVENFLALAQAQAGAGKIDLSAVRLASIGPVTTETLARHGLRAAVTANPHTIEALVDALVAAEAKGTEDSRGRDG